MRIYTGGGDEGETSLFGGGRVTKDDLHVQAYGDVDELTSHLGWAAAHLGGLGLTGRIREIQGDLLTVGSDLATPPDAPPEVREKSARLAGERARWLEGRIDALESENAPLTSFILPGGDPGAAALHVCRTVCRRAERSVVTLAREAEVNPVILVYLNRLSDLLFVMARWVNNKKGVGE